MGPEYPSAPMDTAPPGSAAPALAVVEDGLDPKTSQKLSAGSTVSGGRTTGPCLDPAVHIADLVTAALGYPGNPADVG